MQLRQLTIADDKGIYNIRSDESIAEFLDRPICTSLNDAREFINNIIANYENNEVYYWGIFTISSNKLIGTICLWKISFGKKKAEIGFELLPDYQGKGIMKSVVPKVIHFAFDKLALNVLEGEVAKNNLRSIKLLENIGFNKSKNAGSSSTYIYELFNGN